MQHGESELELRLCLRCARSLEYNAAEFLDRFAFLQIAGLSQNPSRNQRRCRDGSGQSKCFFEHRTLLVDTSVWRIHIPASINWTANLSGPCRPQTKLSERSMRSSEEPVNRRT